MELSREKARRLEVRQHPQQLDEETETSLTLDNEGLTVYSCYPPGIRWALSAYIAGQAELLRFTEHNGSITSVTVKMSPASLTFKSKPRASDKMSDCFKTKKILPVAAGS